MRKLLSSPLIGIVGIIVAIICLILFFSSCATKSGNYLVHRETKAKGMRVHPVYNTPIDSQMVIMTVDTLFEPGDITYYNGLRYKIITMERNR